MSEGLHTESVARFAYGAATRARGGEWAALVVPDEARVDAVSGEVRDQVELFTDGPVEQLGDLHSVESLMAALHASTAPALVVPVRAWPAEIWRALDRARQQLPVERLVVFVLSEESFKTMAREAPNLSSFLDSSTSAYAPDESVMTSEERSRRLEWLRLETGKTDSELLDLAEAKQLPSDSLYAEWLLLLGRGDLL